MSLDQLLAAATAAADGPTLAIAKGDRKPGSLEALAKPAAYYSFDADAANTMALNRPGYAGGFGL